MQDKSKLIQSTFNDIAEGYDRGPLRFFVNAAGHIAEYLGVKGDEHVLEIAAGTGNATVALAPHLPKGRITAIDFSEGMLSVARRKMAANDIRNVELMRMDMQRLDFPSSHFDAAVCAFGIFFAEDMHAQLVNIADKVRPGGRVLITSFLDLPFPALTRMLFGHLEEYGVDLDPYKITPLSSSEQCEKLFNGAGLGDIRIDVQSVGYHLDSPGQWWEVIWNAGYRRFVKLLPKERIKGFMEEHLERVKSLATPEGIYLEVNVLYTRGVKG